MVAQRDEMTARIPGIGAEGIDALRAARVLVVGAGGLGSPVLAYLAAAGVGTRGISDPDRLEESNLQRQVIHSSRRLGMVKAESARLTVQALNPEITVHLHDKIVDGESDDVIAAYDIVVDATDNFAAKYAISDACARLGRPHVWGTLVGMTFQASFFDRGITLRDLYPVVPEQGTTASSATEGVLGAVCGQGGSLLATETLKWITGVGDLLCGKLLIVDARAGKWNVVPFRSPNAVPAAHSAGQAAVRTTAASPAPDTTAPFAHPAPSPASSSSAHPTSAS